MCKCVQLHRPPRVAATRKVYCTATRCLSCAACNWLRAAWLRVVCLDDDTVIRAQRCICNSFSVLFHIEKPLPSKASSNREDVPTVSM